MQARVAVLERGFYQRPTLEVARDLLGKIIVRTHPEGEVAVRLAEVEAYLGPDDPACHTAGGRRTPRVRSMWGEAGHAYVYLIYGIHHCLNVVTVGPEVGEAILLRGGAIVAGEELIRRRRGHGPSVRDLVNGPGKLCRALAVDLKQDGADLCGKNTKLRICDDGWRPKEGSVFRTPRIGIENAGEAVQWQLRFVLDRTDLLPLPAEGEA